MKLLYASDVIRPEKLSPSFIVASPRTVVQHTHTVLLVLAKGVDAAVGVVRKIYDTCRLQSRAKCRKNGGIYISRGGRSGGKENHKFKTYCTLS